MFTGIIQALGTADSPQPSGTNWRVEVSAPETFWSGVRTGESIAVDGVCLTLAARSGTRASFDLLEETRRTTTLGSFAGGGRTVNLEKALAVGERMGGHWLSGHVDGQGRLLAADMRRGDRALRIAFPGEFERNLVAKGSVAVDGVSLTVVDLEPGWFSVHLVPETLSKTSLGNRRAGQTVNLEFDIVGKYVERLLRLGSGSAGGLTWETLKEHGFTS